ncbi:DUF6702 family protein [Roseimaritima ulvae]|uniref:Uncharacterized protein n=1 Tax=Roseimaritima ulvae TaxID=980254 RepID=A0A5B9QR08_9BACT|nr:DUF6702 family protein [Roseimaritima ulvae]QEG40349.1 hypothetical protein UC8_23580 [Roseimaritima ulvae]
MFLVLLFSCLVHPYHRSLAEVQWNTESQRYEVALRVDPRDLDNALSDQHRRPVVLDRMDEADANAMLKAYVGKHLRLLRPQSDSNRADEDKRPDKAATMHWVGFEADDRGKYLWLYFEWTPASGEAPQWIENRLFMKTEPTHISTLVFTELDKRPALVFTKQRSRQPLPEAAAAR